ncbi:MAG: FG-GAP repeat domain-containing protein [Verrucomicrobiota bacterium]
MIPNARRSPACLAFRRALAAGLAGLAGLAGGARAADNLLAAPRAGFTVVAAPAAGIDFTNAVPPARYLTNQIYLNGGGVALGDLDGDGRSEVFFAGAAGRSGLYRNLGGWQFTNVTAAAGLDLRNLDATGAVLADLDGSGSLDLVVNTVGQGTRFWWNDGAGRFRPGPVLNPGRAGMSVAVADVDGDGDLDLYVANYRGNTLRDDPGATFRCRTRAGASG